jgi:hypothetical protein
MNKKEFLEEAKRRGYVEGAHVSGMAYGAKRTQTTLKAPANWDMTFEKDANGEAVTMACSDLVAFYWRGLWADIIPQTLSPDRFRKRVLDTEDYLRIEIIHKAGGVEKNRGFQFGPAWFAKSCLLDTDRDSFNQILQQLSKRSKWAIREQALKEAGADGDGYGFTFQLTPCPSFGSQWYARNFLADASDKEFADVLAEHKMVQRKAEAMAWAAENVRTVLALKRCPGHHVLLPSTGPMGFEIVIL